MFKFVQISRLVAAILELKFWSIEQSTTFLAAGRRRPSVSFIFELNKFVLVFVGQTTAHVSKCLDFCVQ